MGYVTNIGLAAKKTLFSVFQCFNTFISGHRVKYLNFPFIGNGPVQRARQENLFIINGLIN